MWGWAPEKAPASSHLVYTVEAKIKKFRCYETKIEESEKAVSHQESNPGHLASAVCALPLSYSNWTTTSPHNPLNVLVPGTEMTQSHTWQPLSMYCQNSIRGGFDWKGVPLIIPIFPAWGKMLWAEAKMLIEERESQQLQLRAPGLSCQCYDHQLSQFSFCVYFHHR